MGKQIGTSTGGIEVSSRYRRKQAAARRREEAGWADQHGPTLITIAGRSIYVKSQARKDIEAARRVLLAAIAGGAPEGLVELDDAGAGPRPA
jgi:hypothetical protein